jgi:competence protein ComEC
VLLLSGQDERIETAAACSLGFIAGLLAWQLSGGEAWLPTEPLQPALQAINGFRETLIDRIFLTLPEPHGSLLTGILIGNRAKLDPELLEVFRTVGLTHLIAVSGYNLSILTSNIRSLLWPILGRRSVAIALGVIIVFVILSGAPPSILRAAVMAASLLVAQFLGRPSRSINLLLLAAGLLAFFEPKILFEIGFQLSLAATYGLIRLAPVIIHWLERFTLLPESARQIIGETLAATVITAPLLVYYFDRLSLVSPLSNLLVLPIMPLLMGLGIIGCFFLFLVPGIGQYVIQLSWPLLEWIVWISQKLAAVPHASSTVATRGWVAITVFVVTVVSCELLYAWWRRREPDIEIKLGSIRI